MRRICVFCGSSMGRNPAYAAAAQALGRSIAALGLDLVYGGGNVGLMGCVAQSAQSAGARVIGIIPRSLLDLEVGHIDASELHVVPTMHERKAMMADLADAFIALPGGIGTMEEMFETWTWGQLGLHAKPAGFLDVAGYYDHLWTFLDHMQTEGFLQPRHRSMVVRHSCPTTLLNHLRQTQLPEAVKIINRQTA